MEYIDMYELLGINLDTVETKKKVPNIKEPKTIGSNNSSTIKTIDLIDVKKGVKLITGYYDSIEFTRNDFTNDLVEEKEVISHLAMLYKEFTPSLCNLKQLQENQHLVYFSSSKFLDNSTNISIKDDKFCCIRLAGFESVIEEKEISLEHIKEVWESLYPEFKGCDYLYSEEQQVIVPVLKGVEEEKYCLPLTFSIFGRNKFLLEDSDFISNGENSDVLENSSDDSDEEEDMENLEEGESDGENTTDKVKKISSSTILNYKLIKKKLAEKIGEFEEYFKIIHINNQYFICPNANSLSNPVKPTKKEEVFPTDGTTLSLAFIRITLNPDLFYGKKEVTKKELLKYLSEDYPEYSADRTRIDYDIKSKTIIAYLVGSRKGMDIVNDPIEMERRLLRPYTLMKYVESDSSYRVEKTPIGLFVANLNKEIKDRNIFALSLPLIPFTILEEIYVFFSLMNKKSKGLGNGLEAACQIFFDIDKNKYFVYYPKQKVSTYRVDIERSIQFENDCTKVLVMDVHSHHYMVAKFSMIDDMDEKGTRLFAVMGNMQRNSFELTVRAGTGGLYIPVLPETIFKNYNTCVHAVASELLDMAEMVV